MLRYTLRFRARQGRGREKENVRKYWAFILIAAMLICFPAVVLAQTYTFGDVRASVEIPADYETILTPYNLAAQDAYLSAAGLDADALLAGITVDTKGFAINTGVRTFDAASWLRRMGADNANVRSFFKLKLF